MVSEFNVVDDHIGDITLNFAANCISGCDNGSTSATNTGNGTGSTNTADATNVTNTNNFQNNDATVGNSLNLASNSGNNTAEKNTGGDSTITTGDANTAGNVLTLANNNVEGNIVYGVVNIFGDLHGDIIFPEEQLTGCCGTSNTAASNTGNGTDSTNTASSSNTTNSDTTQNNNANIQNNVNLAAQSGDNETSKNTDGTSSVTSGSTNTQASVVNVANSNIDGPVWLVIVNQAGQWIGHIIGAATGSTAAGSSDIQLTVDPVTGEISATNNGNGADSTNTVNAANSSNTTTIQTNNANIVNNVNLSANTGGNTASKNTGGNSTITTGDAKVIASIVNFVNNNISGGGKLFVTVVNVFGSWVGNFVGPGQQKETTAAVAQNPPAGGAVGGPTENTNTASSTNSPGTSATSTITTAATTPAASNLTSLLATTSHQPTGSPLIAGYNISAPQTYTLTPAVDSSKITINLAWLILAIPFGILWAIRKKIAQLLSTLPKATTTAVGFSIALLILLKKQLPF
jgi:hypothetical protein